NLISKRNALKNSNRQSVNLHKRIDENNSFERQKVSSFYTMTTELENEGPPSLSKSQTRAVKSGKPSHEPSATTSISRRVILRKNSSSSFSSSKPPVLSKYLQDRAAATASRLARYEIKAQLQQDALFAPKTKEQIQIELFGSVISDDEEEEETVILPVAVASTIPTPRLKTHLWSSCVSTEHQEFLHLAKSNVALQTRMLEAVKQYLIDKLDIDELRLCGIYVKRAPAVPKMRIPDVLKSEFVCWFAEGVESGFTVVNLCYD
ncbi:hypothetical protein BDR26DRAFT_870689, partial [Obelidium mucronatum]